MSKTKKGIVDKAYWWLTISGITSDPSPDEISHALDTLESMMNEFLSRNICSDYILEAVPMPTTNSKLEVHLNNAIETNLALRLAAAYGKQVPATLQRQATQSLSNWSARSGKVNQINPPRTQPRGKGNTFRFTNFIRYYRFENNAPISCDTFDLKVDEVNFFEVDFNQYLNIGETISSFTIKNTTGIKVNSSSEIKGVIKLECLGIKAGYNTVTITLTTSSNRVNPANVDFNVI